jgi:AcrR family transcriptional regulator
MRVQMITIARMGKRRTVHRLKAPQRRQQLITVATRVFARFGYNAATTHAIAQAAGITEPILYRHFRSKQVLFVAIARQMSRQTMDHWRERIADVPAPAEQIRVIAREFPQHLRRLGDAYHVIHGALATSRDRKVVAVMKEHYAQIEAFFTEIIVNGQKAGQFRSDLDPKVPAWQLIHQGIGYTMIAQNLASFNHFPIADAIESIVRGIKA